MHGGEIVMSTSVDEGCTHIVFDRADLSRLPAYQAARRARGLKPSPHLVSHEWVEACLQHRACVDEGAFRL